MLEIASNYVDCLQFTYGLAISVLAYYSVRKEKIKVSRVFSSSVFLNVHCQFEPQH